MRNRLATSLVMVAALFPTSGASCAALSAPGRTPAPAPIPVILCTDIGDDIDDTWALVMLLKSPELDLRLVATTYGKADYRARIVAKLLTVAGRADVPAARAALLAPWRRTVITPLDTCGLVRLKGGTFRAFRASPDPLVRALMENYRLWAKKGSVDELTESSVLFDTVAIYLAYPGPKPLLSMEELPLDVTEDGMTRVGPSGARMSVATSWTDLAEYGRMLARRLGGKEP